jgi:hypothetical protein
VNRLFGGPFTQRDNGSALNFIIHSDGFLTYRVMGQTRHEFRPPLGTVVVQDFCHTTDQAHIELLEALLGLEMFHDIEIEVSVDDPLPLKLSDQRAAHTTGVSDSLWLRIMNVPDVLGTRAYPADADVVLEVTDPLGVAGGLSLLQTRDGAGTCKPHQGPPTSKSVWLTWERSSWGVHRASELRRARRIDELRSGALQELEAAFSTERAPYYGTLFQAWKAPHRVLRLAPKRAGLIQAVVDEQRPLGGGLKTLGGDGRAVHAGETVTALRIQAIGHLRRCLLADYRWAGRSVGLKRRSGKWTAVAEERTS